MRLGTLLADLPPTPGIEFWSKYHINRSGLESFPDSKFERL
jgi:hypothetical protein